MIRELAQLDATAQAALVREGAASPAELVEAALARIERHDPELGAVVTPLFESAREAAARGDLPEGPFRGVPILLKDLGATSRGDPLYAGMRALAVRDHRPARDSYVVEKLRAAGFVVVGKSATPELGLLPTTEPLAFGPTKSPYAPARSPGGSSGGAAAAVAAGLVPIAHASDGGGSIRIPASCCGLVGLKPSRGRVSLGPDRGEVGAGLATELAVTRSVRDAAAMLDALAGPMPGDPCPLPAPEAPFSAALGRDPGRLRVATWSQFFAPDGTRASPHPACADAVDDAARLLEGAGHRVERAAYAPLEDPGFPRAFQKLWSATASAGLAAWSETLAAPLGEADVEPVTWALAELGRALSAADYLSLCGRLSASARRGASLWGDFDLLLTPTLAEPPPPLGAFRDGAAALDRAARFSPFTAALNVSGEPAITLPLAAGPEGLPIGVQLAAPHGREDLLVSVAAQLERARPFSHPATRG